MLYLLTLAAAAPCPTSGLTAGDVVAELDALWDLGQADDVAFRTGLPGVEARLACVVEPLSPQVAARVHRNRALLALRSGDRQGADRSLARMQHLSTEEEAAPWLASFPDRSPGAPPPTRVAEFGTSLAASVYVDGRLANERPLDEPVVLQVFDASDQPVDAVWLSPRAPLPSWVQYPPAACEGRRSTSEIVDASDRAATAFAALDVDGFEVSLGTAATALPCVDGVLSPTEAAALHRLEGVRLYTRGAEDSALRSLQQARILDPLGTMEGDAFAPGSPIARLWDRAAEAAPPPWVPVDAPEGLQVRVDGIPARQRPVTVPSVVQLTTPTGRVVWTNYVPAMAVLPPLDRVAPADAVVQELAPARQLYQDDEARRARTRRTQWLVIGGSSMLLASGVAWQANRNAVSDYEAPETSPEFLERYRLRANRTATASVVTGVAGLGLFGAAIAFEL